MPLFSIDSEVRHRSAAAAAAAAAKAAVAAVAATAAIAAVAVSFLTSKSGQREIDGDKKIPKNTERGKTNHKVSILWGRVLVRLEGARNMAFQNRECV